MAKTKRAKAVSPARQAMTDSQIGAWMLVHKMANAKGVLPAWQATRLEQIPGWPWDLTSVTIAKQLLAMKVFLKMEAANG